MRNTTFTHNGCEVCPSDFTIKFPGLTAGYHINAEIRIKGGKPTADIYRCCDDGSRYKITTSVIITTLDVSKRVIERIVEAYEQKFRRCFDLKSLEILEISEECDYDGRVYCVYTLTKKPVVFRLETHC